ncbi:MAG: Flp pilus assembly protein CpaB [Planctomycetota bacterium]
MKWAVVFLIGLGLLAAFSALLLVNALRSEKRAEFGGKGEVNAVVAVRSLPAMSRITLQNITVKKVPRKGLDVDYFSDPAQVIGKVLAVPVVQDQPLSKKYLITEGGGAQLAAGLPYGMRAMSVPVSKHSVMGGLLYPGCVVDVIATFRLDSWAKDAKGQAISTTLLHNVQVLAIQDESIVSKTEPGKTPPKEASGSSDRLLTVTLMVDGRQAEALQLAMDNGKVTIAMRNPLDQKTVDSEAMVLSQGRLAKLGELMATSVYVASPAEQGYMDANGMDSIDPNRAIELSAETRSTEQLRRFFGDEFGGRTSPQWEITVIRGREVKEELVEISTAEASASNESK